MNGLLPLVAYGKSDWDLNVFPCNFCGGSHKSHAEDEFNHWLTFIKSPILYKTGYEYIAAMQTRTKHKLYDCQKALENSSIDLEAFNNLSFTKRLVQNVRDGKGFLLRSSFEDNRKKLAEEREFVEKRKVFVSNSQKYMSYVENFIKDSHIPKLDLGIKYPIPCLSKIHPSVLELFISKKFDLTKRDSSHIQDYRLVIQNYIKRPDCLN